MTKKIALIFLLYLHFFSSSLFSETILLRNGQIIQGKVLGHDSESVTINTEGATKVIPKSTVHKVIFSSNSAIATAASSFLKSDSDRPDDDEELSSLEEMVDDKQDITKKVSMLEQKIDKYEKKISNLRSKITKLKQKIKSKSNAE